MVNSVQVHRAATVAFLVAFLAGCNTYMTGDMQSAQGPTPARDFLLRGDEPGPAYSVKGYLIFSTRPIDERQHHRYLVACNAYVSSFERVEDLPEKLVLLPTFWPLESELEHEECDEMLLKYDYARATVIAASSNADIGAGEGPFLLATNGSETMQFDMTLFSNQDIYRAVRIWKDEIAKDPSHWEPRLSLIKFRENFRSMLQAYGAEILKYFG